MNRSRLFALTGLAVLAACSAPESDVSLEEQAAIAQADSVREAAAMYDPTAYDSISWETEEAAQERGMVVFNYSCRKCHGEAGAGDGGFVQRGDTLRPPTFLAEDWDFADDRDGLRRQVFVGTAEGMPHWGFHGLRYRDIDAVAIYIQDVLRK